jgi:hypothetical protein
MPTKHSMPFQEKLHAIGLIEGAKHSLRKVSTVIGVAKSTLHDNLDNYRKDIAAFEEFQQGSERDLAKDVLLLSFDAKTSSRDCANVLSKQRSESISHKKVLSLLSELAVTARKKTSRLSPLKSLASRITLY